MDYDNRITNPEMIFNCFDSKHALEHFKNHKGYFADDISNYSDLNYCEYGKLTDADIESKHYIYQKDNDNWLAFFLPEAGVIEKKEKKYRPYTIEDFETCEFVVFREKNNPSMEYHVRYNGYRKCGNFYKVILGNISYTFSDLFENFEYFYNGRWKPFGVKEE